MDAKESDGLSGRRRIRCTSAPISHTQRSTLALISINIPAGSAPLPATPSTESAPQKDRSVPTSGSYSKLQLGESEKVAPFTS
jgi:hypothetical protein